MMVFARAQQKENAYFVAHYYHLNGKLEERKMIKPKCYICGYKIEEVAITKIHYWYDLMKYHFWQKHNISGKFDDLLDKKTE